MPYPSANANLIRENYQQFAKHKIVYAKPAPALKEGYATKCLKARREQPDSVFLPHPFNS